MNYESAKDLVKWAKEQLNSQTQYELGGIGRWKNGVRIFDCMGLVKCFCWHNYPETTKYYNKSCPDYNTEQMYAYAKEKGTIHNIPELEGVIVYMKGHVGIYALNGEVIEATSKRWNGVGNKVVKSQFKNPKGSMYRGTWTHWFKMPMLNYEIEKPKKEENIVSKFEVGQKVLLNKNATTYQGNSKGVKIPSSIKNKEYTIQEVSKDTLLLKEIYSWVLASECALVEEQSYITYTVKKGDNLWNIATKYLGKGTRFTKIAKLNNIKAPFIIKEGKKIKIPV